jgi:ABC-type antimicrobial peptide transport system permease subunit
LLPGYSNCGTAVARRQFDRNPGFAATAILILAVWLTAAGVPSGLLCSVGISLPMRKLLFGFEAWEPPALACAGLLLGLASMCASFLPAHRAASVNPVDALPADC